MPDISIIVPVYNEAEVLDEFFRRLFAVAASEALKEYSFEIVCIDDGSTDATGEILHKYSQSDPRVKYITFSRNFGKDASLIAGLKYCSGCCAIPMDADLQDPPELIEKFVAKWREGYEVVCAVRSNRDSDSYLKRKTSELFYKFYNAVSDRSMPYNAGDFRLISRKVVNALMSLRERSVFMKGLFNWVGFRTCVVEYVRPPRASGRTKWDYWKLWNFALDGITAGTTLPLRIWTYVGSCTALLSLAYAFYIVVRTIVRGVDVPGYASLIVSILFFGSVQLIALGIFGEYIGRICTEVRGRPLYVVDKTVGFGESGRESKNI